MTKFILYFTNSFQYVFDAKNSEVFLEVESLFNWLESEIEEDLLSDLEPDFLLKKILFPGSGPEDVELLPISIIRKRIERIENEVVRDHCLETLVKFEKEVISKTIISSVRLTKDELYRTDNFEQIYPFKANIGNSDLRVIVTDEDVLYCLEDFAKLCGYNCPDTAYNQYGMQFPIESEMWERESNTILKFASDLTIYKLVDESNLKNPDSLTDSFFCLMKNEEVLREIHEEVH